MSQGWAGRRPGGLAAVARMEGVNGEGRRTTGLLDPSVPVEAHLHLVALHDGWHHALAAIQV
jgi:hypothetical protein